MIFMIGAPIFQRPAQAAPPAGAVLAIGVVDLSKLEAGAKQKAALDEQIKAMNDRLQAAFSQQEGANMLSKDQQDELYTLLNKPSPTDSDTARITELEGMSGKDAQELTTLQQKTNPTDADKQRLAVLTGEAGQANKILSDIAQEYRDQAQAESDRLGQQLLDSITAAIAAVAKQNGLMLVFDKSVALYGANDITTDVLARLNK